MYYKNNSLRCKRLSTTDGAMLARARMYRAPAKMSRTKGNIWYGMPTEG